mmetsp:Transcript_81205/g.159367  ORF Transcript_81205/g.159367 Transcript_81205/m.159367 type:complete len:260 (+) Transcript_81205:792-1571(+)
MKIFTISSMSEMPVVDLIVAKACSNTSMFFWCCLMCRLWIVLRKASFKILRIIAGELKCSSSSALRLLVLLFLSSSALMDCLTMFTRCVSSSRSRSFICFCKYCTVDLKCFRSSSSCFLSAEIRCCRSSCSRRAASVSRCSMLTCWTFSLMSPCNFLKTWFICNRSLRVMSIFVRRSAFSWHRTLSWLIACSSLCSSCLTDGSFSLGLLFGADFTTFSSCSAFILVTSSSSLFSLRFSSSSLRVVDSISLCTLWRWSWR